jgi:hypothetical protein
MWGDMMISSDCDFSDFFAAVKDKHYQDIIYLADQEATAAERLLYRNEINGDQKHICREKYASILKDLVSYMQSSIRPKHRKNEYFELFALILESAKTKKGLL